MAFSLLFSQESRVKTLRETLCDILDLNLYSNYCYLNLKRGL